MDYGKLKFLLASELIVWGEVTATGKKIEFTIIKILKGKRAKFKIADIPGDSKSMIGCMADLKWNKGEKCCLFLGKAQDGKLYIRGHGNGKVKLPYRGIMDLEQLDKIINEKG